MMDVSVNYAAVAAAAFAGLALGMFWYGPVFGKTWMRLMKMTAKDMKKMRLTAGQAMAGGAVSMLVTSYALALLVGYAGVASFGSAALLAGVLWLGVGFPIIFGGFLWENRSLALTAFNAAHKLVELLLMVSILAAWM